MALAVMVLLSACGSEVSNPIGTPLPTVTGSPTGSDSAAMPPNGRARPTTMAGRVTSTTGGCIVFKNETTGDQWVLVGEAKDYTVGTAYILEGVAMDTMDPTCGQALPFHVAEKVQNEFSEDRVPLPSRDAQGVPVLLSGTVSDGVEAGCLVLRTDEGTFVLTGTDGGTGAGTVDVTDGDRVTVHGLRRDDMASICQQGPIVEVLSVHPLR